MSPTTISEQEETANTLQQAAANAFAYQPSADTTEAYQGEADAMDLSTAIYDPNARQEIDPANIPDSALPSDGSDLLPISDTSLSTTDAGAGGAGGVLGLLVTWSVGFAAEIGSDIVGIDPNNVVTRALLGPLAPPSDETLLGPISFPDGVLAPLVSIPQLDDTPGADSLILSGFSSSSSPQDFLTGPSIAPSWMSGPISVVPSVSPEIILQSLTPTVVNVVGTLDASDFAPVSMSEPDFTSSTVQFPDELPLNDLPQFGDFNTFYYISDNNSGGPVFNPDDDSDWVTPPDGYGIVYSDDGSGVVVPAVGDDGGIPGGDGGSVDGGGGSFSGGVSLDGGDNTDDYDDGYGGSTGSGKPPIL